MVTTTQTCDRDGTSREIADKSHRRNYGWRNIEGLELCPDCVTDFKVWVKAGKPADE